MEALSPERASQRATAYWPVSLWGDVDEHDAVCVNVSRGGMALALTAPVPLGTLLRVTAVLPGGFSLDATAVVMWARGRGPEQRIGIRFLSLRQDALTAVADWVAEAA